MKIISGLYKNRELLSPNNKKTHPMGSREKLALFNMLAPFLGNASVLDAFSGSGALGLEALSRGAKSVVFVEKSPKVAGVIKKNCEALNLPAEVYKIIISDINKVDFLSKKFNIILADPPYDNFKIEEIARLVNSLETDGILALSSPKENLNKPYSSSTFPETELLSSHTYAAARISLFKKI